MKKPRYRLSTDGRARQVPADATARFVRAAAERWTSVCSRLEPAPYDPHLCDAHGIHVSGIFSAMRGETSASALKARAMLLQMGIDCQAQQVTEPGAAHSMALDLLMQRTLDMREQVRMKRREARLKLLIQEFPELARSEIASPALPA